MKNAAQGWYLDPYGLHQDRYFSDGHPTKLVRDDGAESYDQVPADPLPDVELVSAEPADVPDNGSDLIRADASDDRYSGRAAGRGVFDSVAGSWPPQ